MPRSTLPAGYIAPMLPTLVDVAPDGGEWIHEIKYDGYRTQLALSGQVAQAFTRNGYDWTAKYEPVVAAAQALNCRSAIIDGEMCVQNDAGVTDFKALRSAIKSAPERLVLFGFDLLMLNGRDLRAEPLVDRRRRLRDLIGADATARIAISGEHVGEGPMFYQAADQHGLEGIVSKRADSRYVSGRATSWLKVKSFTVGDFAVVGVERSSTGIPVALLATLGRDPAYVGNAMVTLKATERDQFWRSVETMGTPRARLAGLSKNKKATWIREGLWPAFAISVARRSCAMPRCNLSTSAGPPRTTSVNGMRGTSSATTIFRDSAAGEQGKDRVRTGLPQALTRGR